MNPISSARLEPGDKLLVVKRPYPNPAVLKVSLWGQEYRTTESWLRDCTIPA